jgi:hypothetical protein
MSVDNVEMDLRDIGWNDLDWVHVAQDRDQPSGSMKCWEVLEGLHKWWLLKMGSAQ